MLITQLLTSLQGLYRFSIELLKCTMMKIKIKIKSNGNIKQIIKFIIA